MSREQFWFFHPFRVRYSEIDGQGVVFNAHYLTYFDTTITSLNTRRRSGSTGSWTSVRAWRGSAIQASPSNSRSS
jgi:hypothetical protein